MIGSSATSSALVIALTTIAPGWWQTRTLVGGTSAAILTTRCIDGADWVREVLPSAITAGCNAAASRSAGFDVTCDRSGRLTVTGTASIDRFDIVARRSGRIAAHPDAVAVLHVEGQRIAASCPKA